MDKESHAHSELALSITFLSEYLEFSNSWSSAVNGGLDGKMKTLDFNSPHIRQSTHFLHLSDSLA